jgi:hypothetical protein
MIPAEYREIYRLTRTTPYDAQERSREDGGVLNAGHVVWTRQRLGQREPAGAVNAYVAEVGAIWIDPRCLVPF